MSTIVVYDESCRGPHGPLGLKLPGLTTAWSVGSALFRAAGRVEHVIAANGWRQALESVVGASGGAPIDEIQFWCHGKWGEVLLGVDVFDIHALSAESPLAPALDRLRDAMTGQNALLWFRTCETFGGAAGRRFAEAAAERLQCRVAGHTYIIGPLQSGLHALAPGERAGWSTTEGIVEGTGDAPRRAAWSAVRAPRTITCFHSKLPRWAGDARAEQ